MTIRPADARKLYQQVAGAVASAISAGQYPVGSRLPSERDLAEEFGVSRPTVREAMIALEIRGLVEARHGSGIYVMEGAEAGAPPLDLDIGAFELTEARRLFEGEACALAASVISDDELAELESILADMVGENSLATSIGEQADRRFHLAIARATRNTAILMVVETLWDIRYRSPLCAAMLTRARQVGVRPLIEDHREILDALIQRNPKAARQVMRAHLGRVIDGLLIATEIDALDRARSDVEERRRDIARRSSV
jgi:GntR family hexuronate regulon transcriptional repressor